MIKKETLWIACSIVLIIGLVGLFCFIKPITTQESCLYSKDGICLDLNSSFCGCNLTSHSCPSRERGLCNLVQCLNEKKIVLYFSSSCSYCQKELQELYPFQDSIQKVDCQTQQCSGISGVPSWKINNKIIKQGYAPPDVLFEEFGCLDIN